ncbi:hypothetical protein V8Q34_26845 [Blautia sp. JLR.GB0024]|uniref:hypothetical protein n=1 Tax=Blautia sp. JLR.GB0024 TaxID=3123295 RepID=UPI003007BB91
MDKLKSDSDIMVYLRNVRIALQKISAQTGLNIDIHATPDGYAYVETGDYTAIQYDNDTGFGETYEYRSKTYFSTWRDVELQQIVLDGEPKEKVPDAGKQTGTKEK